METKIDLVHGEMVPITVCKPSRRKAASNIQRPKYNKGHQQGAKHCAEEADQYIR